MFFGIGKKWSVAALQYKMITSSTKLLRADESSLFWFSSFSFILTERYKVSLVVEKFLSIILSLYLYEIYLSSMAYDRKKMNKWMFHS